MFRNEHKTSQEAATRISSKNYPNHKLDTISNQTFCSCKSNLVTSPLLLSYDNSRSIFLKTDWSAGGIGYILMQLDDSPDYLAAVAHLTTTGEYLFDVSLDGPILRPVLFGSRANLSYERNYHSFVREVACRRWSIAVCRK